jgi:RNA polymerase sigma factor (sigma-70 family)
VSTDIEILKSLQGSSPDKALQVLYKRLRPKIRNYILRNGGSEEDVGDVFQESLIIFLKQVKLDKFDSNYEIDGYVFSIARNLWIKEAKKQNKKTSMEELGHLEIPSSQSLFSEILVKERQTLIDQLFSELGERCKDMLLNTIFHHMSMKEIAEKMGFANENAAKTSHYKCKQRLIALVENRKEELKKFLTSE